MKKSESRQLIKEIIQEEMDTAILKPGDEVSITVDDRRFGVYGIKKKDGTSIKTDDFNNFIKSLGSKFMLFTYFQGGNTIPKLDSIVDTLESNGIKASWIDKDFS